VPNDPLEFNACVLEIHQKTDTVVRRTEIIEALREMLSGQAFDALELHDQLFFNKKICEEVADPLSFVSHRESGFGGGSDASELEFVKKGALVNSLEKSRAEGIGNFENRIQNVFSEDIEIHKGEYRQVAVEGLGYADERR